MNDEDGVLQGARIYTTKTIGQKYSNEEQKGPRTLFPFAHNVVQPRVGKGDFFLLV